MVRYLEPTTEARLLLLHRANVTTRSNQMKLTTTTTATFDQTAQLAITATESLSIDTWGNVTARSGAGGQVCIQSKPELIAAAVAHYVSSLQYVSDQERIVEATKILQTLQAKLTECLDVLRAKQAA